MAIRAADIALPDLNQELIAPAPSSEKGDRLEFMGAISVVELEDKSITLTAVDAGMHAEILVDLAS